MDLQQDVANTYFRYEDGMLFWKLKSSKNSHSDVGQRAGSVHMDGYRAINLKNFKYLEHRVIWVMHNGEIPPEMQIDHINMIRNDNRLSNLRVAERRQNVYNTLTRRNSESGIKGVYFNKKTRKWVANINVGKRKKHLGVFTCPKKASEAFKKAAKVLHGDFFNPNNNQVVEPTKKVRAFVKRKHYHEAQKEIDNICKKYR